MTTYLFRVRVHYTVTDTGNSFTETINVAAVNDDKAKREALLYYKTNFAGLRDKIDFCEIEKVTVVHVS